MLHAFLLLALLAPLQDRWTRVADGPEPAPRPVAWELDFEYLTPRKVEVQLPGSDRTETYWYLVYTVTNTSKTTQQFHPFFELVTEDLRTFRTDRGMPPIVFDTIKQRHAVTHPYLVSPTEAIGPLKSGSDYARESVAIWRADDIDTARFTIYVAGLSGEARRIRNPAYDSDEPTIETRLSDTGEVLEAQQNPRFFTIRKTLAIRFIRPVAPGQRATATPELQSQAWIMR